MALCTSKEPWRASFGENVKGPYLEEKTHTEVATVVLGKNKSTQEIKKFVLVLL